MGAFLPEPCLLPVPVLGPCQGSPGTLLQSPDSPSHLCTPRPLLTSRQVFRPPCWPERTFLNPALVLCCFCSTTLCCQETKLRLHRFVGQLAVQGSDPPLENFPSSCSGYCFR